MEIESMKQNLSLGFSIVEANAQEFDEIVGDLKESIFENEMNMWPRDVMSESEKGKLSRLNENYAKNDELYLLLLKGEKLAGWSYGRQDTRESFLMVSSAILPEFRGQGLYSLLLDRVLHILIEKGFQRIWSLHKANNNRILIPKLKKGFVITGMKLVDMTGACVELTYFTNEVRKKVMEFRTGHRKPDQELKTIFKIE